MGQASGSSLAGPFLVFHEAAFQLSAGAAVVGRLDGAGGVTSQVDCSHGSESVLLEA